MTMPQRLRPDLKDLWTLLLFALPALCLRAEAQAPSGKPDPALPPPPVTYRGLIPGRSTVAEVRAALGQPLEEHRWYSYKLLYPAEGRPGHFDAVHLRSSNGQEGELGGIEAASIPPGLKTLAEVKSALGEPEFYLEFHRQSLADYSEKGVRFTFDLQGNTIGAAYFPHGRRRIHSGERRFLSLRALPQGPQPPPERSPPLDLSAGASSVDITPQKAEWLGPVALGKP